MQVANLNTVFWMNSDVFSCKKLRTLKPLFSLAAIELIDHLRSMGETNAVRERILVRSFIRSGLTLPIDSSYLSNWFCKCAP